MRPVMALLVLVLAACRPPAAPTETGAPATGAAEGSAAGVRISLELVGEPALGPAEVRVYLLGGDNEAVSDASVSVTGTMTHAGMEPVLSDAVKTEEGLYRTEDFTFTMAGDWIIQADVTLADGTRAGDEIIVNVPGS